MPVQKLKSLSILAAAVAVLTPSFAAHSADITTQLRAPSALLKAQRSLASGDAEAALTTLTGINKQEVSKSQLEHIEALTCEAYLHVNDAEAAFNACSAALEIDENDWAALNNRAVALMRLGRHEDALVDLQAATRLAPSSKAPMRNKAAVRRTLSMVESD